METIQNHHKIKLKDRFPYLFSAGQLGPFPMENRLIVLPVHTGYAYPDGRVSPLMIEFYTRLAKSGAPMVVVANTAVSSDGLVSGFNLRADRDDFIPGLTCLASSIKSSGALACLQLNHAGRFAKTDYPLLSSPMERSNLAFNLDALKQFMEFFPLEKRFRLTRNLLRQINSWRRAMTENDKERVLSDYTEAAKRAWQSGFDMVELHGANGYLLCQFLSGFTNREPDGSIPVFEKRTEFPLAVLKAVKSVLPDNFPVGFRLLLKEFVPGGICFEEALAFSNLLEKAGITYLSVSVASYLSLFSQNVMKIMARPGYLKKEVKHLTQASGVPTVISGRIIKPDLADRLIKEGVADFIGLGRPIRCDPRWVLKAADHPSDIVSCINCNWCIKQIVLDKGFTCARWPQRFQERTELEHQLLKRNSRSLLMVAGIEDARIYKETNPFFQIFLDKEAPPDLLFIEDPEKEPLPESERESFVHWFSQLTKASVQKVKTSILPSGGDTEKAMHKEIAKGEYGRIVLAGNKDKSWLKRFMYGEKGKVILFLKNNPRLYRVMIPIDLSRATLLQMMYLKKTLIGTPGFSFDLMHVLTGPEHFARQRWKELCSVAGLDPGLSISFVPRQNDVAAAIIHEICQGGYGTVFVGKRGLSGIKRWLAGSVSTRIMQGLTDQTLCLID